MKRRGTRRLAAVVVVLLAVVAGAAVFGAEPLLNSEAVRGRVLAAVQRATGHAVEMGRIELTPGSLVALTPVIGVRDVVVANPAGFSRAALASARRIEAKLALLPLLGGRVEVRSVTMVGADALLERDGAGRGNWERPVVAEAGPPGPAASQRTTAVEVESIRVVNGRVEWRGGPAVEVRTLAFAPSGGAVTGNLAVNGVEIVLGGRAGPVGAPFEVTATGGGVVLAVSGAGDGVVGLRGTAAALEAASGLAGRALPALRDVRMTAQAGPGGISGLHVETGALALGSIVPGLQLLTLKADAADLGRPVQVLATGAMNALPIALVGSFGPLKGPGVPVAVQMSADGGTLGLQGVVDTAGRTFEGTVAGRVPDLGRMGALAGVVAPSIRDVAVDVRVAPGPGGVVLLRGLRATSSMGDLAGDLAIGFAPRPSMRGSLVSTSLMLDVPVVAPVPEPQVGQAGGPAAAEVAHPVIPARALPFEVLRRGDADLRLGVGQAVFRGVAYRGVEARWLLQEGRLRVDPLRMTGPGGVVEGQVSADANAVPPIAGLTMRTPGLDAGVLMEGMSGSLELDVAMQAAGASLHAMAGTVTGHASMAVVDGEVENAELARWFGAALKGANVPLEAGGRSRVKCIAVRMALAEGQARVTTLALDATRLRLEGDGTLDLGGETMDMHLRPVIRIGGTGVAVPVRLVGPWRSPRPSADRGVVAPGRFGISIGVPAGDTCGPALAAVRAP